MRSGPNARPPNLDDALHEVGGEYRHNLQACSAEMSDPMAFNVRQIFSALNHANVDYVVVGGMAVILHGYLRATADLDLVLGLAPENCERGLAALSAVGFTPRFPIAIEEFADPAKRRVWIDERNMLVFPLWDPHNPLRSLDLFVEEPIAFERMLREAVMKDIDGLSIRIASIEHLIEMKQAAGRPRDLDDVAKLRQIREEGGSDGEG